MVGYSLISLVQLATKLFPEIDWELDEPTFVVHFRNDFYFRLSATSELKSAAGNREVEIAIRPLGVPVNSAYFLNMEFRLKYSNGKFKISPRR